MTDVSTEPVVGIVPPPAPPTVPPPAPAPEQGKTKQGPAGVAHTAGGWPVVPLATTSVNSTVGTVAAATLAGGPAGAALAVAGAALVGGAVLAHRAIRQRTAKAKTTTKAGAKVPAPKPTPTPSRQPNSSPRAAGQRSAGAFPGGASRGRSGSTGTSASAAPRQQQKGRIGQVRDLRQSARSTAGGATRADRRTAETQARRQNADNRRTTPTPAPRQTPRTHTHTPARDHRAGGHNSTKKRPGSSLRARVGAARDTAVQRARTARDRAAAKAVDGARDTTRTAVSARQKRAMKKAVRKRAWRDLWRSAARTQGRRLLAALLAAPLGVLGLLTTPLGRKLGIGWLQHPGRRFYRRLMRTAEEQRAVRDAAIRERRAAAEATIDADLTPEQQISDTVERPAFLLPATPSSPLEVVNMSGFKFEEAAAEMETAARTYEPDTAMEILDMVEGLPEALTSVANTFRILAERSDSEFPLEKAVAAAFDDIFGALLHAVDAAGDVAPLFRQVHAYDIARHTDPRNGPEAEKGWNV
ncbi:hypothetical protein ACIRQY_10470 [Streptomyces sp. NPDC101490]|uniref:hypothetical protein n=1 Tax=Streptomyces sp. NPDC101490 TaxID=3366143 RepID=UPI0038023332